MILVDDLDLFESPKLLINGAYDGIDKLETLCGTFFEGDPYTVVQKTNNKTGEKIVGFRFEKRLPGFIRVAASSVINDLRHALDQAVCDSVIAFGGNPSKTYFPFARNFGEIDGQIRRNCARAHPQIVEFLKSLEPYLGGDSLLWCLGKNSGVNKHQRIIHIGIAHGLENFAILEAKPPNRIDTRWVNMHNTLEFARIGPGGHLKFNYKLRFDVIFGDIDVIGGQPVLATLRELASKVQGIVMGIEAETARIASQQA